MEISRISGFNEGLDFARDSICSLIDHLNAENTANKKLVAKAVNAQLFPRSEELIC